MPEAAITRLLEYGSLIRDWNSGINLVSRKDVERIETYHILDSLAVAGIIPRDASVCDVGTGAGFPGIPLAIARDDLRMTLVESSRKKCRFIHAALSALDLPRVRLVNDRAESLPPLHCDFVLSRLTASVERFVKEAHQHRSSGGRIVLYKTPESATEVSQIAPRLAKYGLAIADTVDILLPISGITRRFVTLGTATASN